jgi:hypothetical protein
MSRNVCVFWLALIGACASTVLASAQATPSPTDTRNQIEASASPVAYVYVANATTGGNSQINAYAASPNGGLTRIAGSPFQYNVNYMAVTGSWLFGVADMDENIDSFSIGADGALSEREVYNVVNNGDGVISVYLDHTGSTLYADLYSTNNDYLSYSIDHSNGMLNQSGDLPGGPANNSPVSFIGNNKFAYSSSCYHFGPEIIGVQRARDGTLSYLNDFNPPYPAEKSGGFYCPWLAAADPTNHLAIAMSPLTPDWGSDGPTQLATYTVDSSGNLTTTSTYENMPSVLVGGVTNYWMSPSGEFLAVGGSLGLQLFRFNGANPITKKTGLIVAKEVDQVFWDNANHLYAISRTAGKLWVFTVTATSVAPAPGSPHTIANPESLIVLPK